jgi:hypothetical protein
MRADRIVLAILGFVAVLAPAATRADQARDWMVAAQPGGTYVNLDVIFPGIQAMLEHRVPIFGSANELDFRVSALPTIIFLESQADVDLRLVVLTLGASVGYRDVFQNIAFAPGTSATGGTRFDRVARRDVQFGGSYDSATSGFGEGRAILSLPMNDHLVFQSINALRFEGGGDRTFDWRLGVVRDAGMVLRSDSTLFYKHRGFGAIGPQVQVLNYALDGLRNTQINYGFTFTTRPGLRSRDDILFLSVLVGVGGTVNGVPTGDVYGNHLFKMPLTFQLAYRTVLEVSGPPKVSQDD